MNEINNIEFSNRKDTHDFMTEDQIASFLRKGGTGIDNKGRLVLGSIINQYDNPTVLDAACGTCINWEVFQKFNIRCIYTGFDRTSKMLEHAKKLYGSNISLQEGYVQNMPFENESFDIVIMRHILEHLPPGEMEKVIQEGLRVARKELILSFFLEPHSGNEHKYEECIAHQIEDCTYFWNVYSHTKIMDQLSSFKVIKTSPINTQNAVHSDTIYRVIKC